MPEGVPPEAASVAVATLGGAVATAETLPGPVGEALPFQARAAFVDVLQTNAAIATVIVLLASVVAWRILREPAAPVAADKPSVGDAA
jgi:DHA2 family multidrug resistance protein-like MFS transporter